jgi:FkbM family methyltransferase
MRRLLLAALGCAAIAGAALLFVGSDRGVALRHALQMRLKPYAAVTVVQVEGVGPLRLFMNPDDHVVTPLIQAQGLWEANETHWIQEVLRPGDVFVDVGANIGWYTVIGAREVGPRGRVYAFEPDPEAFELLQRNVRANGLHNVVLEQKAVSDAPGTLKLFIAGENKGDHRIYQPEGESRPSVEVEAVTLDEYFKDPAASVDCIKVDTQGAELVILKGSRGLIQRSESIAMVYEFAPFALKGLGGTGSEMLEIFRALGLQSFDLGTGFGGVKPLRPISEEVLLKRYPPDREVFTNLLLVKRRPGVARHAEGG